MPLIIRKHIHLCILFLQILFAIGFIACSPNSLQTAHKTIQQADSLRVIGLTYGDSALLAQAYDIMEGWKWVYQDEFAHVCYHYGRLLRERDNPVAAMECFINATHTSTHDYHILGRVYSNIANICRLAGEHQLSYFIYKSSSDCFLKAQDTLFYFYGLNNMAFELSEQGEYAASFAMIDSINLSCPYASVLAKTCETKVILYKHLHQYDSVISYVNTLQKTGYCEPLSLLSKAQAYYYLQQYDSAANCAQKVLHTSTDLFDKNNAYYILVHCDSVKSTYDVYSLSAHRADVQKQIEIRQGKLSKAVQLLEQDLKKKPNFGWLYAIIVTSLICVSSIYLYRRRQRRKGSLLSQKVEDLSIAYTDLQSNKMANIERVCEMLRTSAEFSSDMHWKNYNKMCEVADNHFYLLTTKLKQQNILNEQEIRLCILVLINYSRNQIAEMLSYAPNGIGKLKYRVAQKLGIEGKNLRKYLLFMAIDEVFIP